MRKYVTQLKRSKESKHKISTMWPRYKCSWEQREMGKGLTNNYLFILEREKIIYKYNGEINKEW